jgi:hypothetical protein
MAVTVQERDTSRRWTTGDSPTLEMIYTCEGSTGEGDIKAAVEAVAPSSYQGLRRSSIDLQPEVIDEMTGLGRWTATVRYARRAAKEVGDSSYSFDTSGGNQHITQSLATISRTAASGTAPDCKGAIGWDGQNVQGVDIVVPTYSFSETHYLSDNDVTEAYKGKLFGLTGKVNNASFKGLAAGECLFLGASGAKRGDDDWEITFRFAARPNRTNVAVGDITVPAAKGWEYLWVRYGPAVSNSSLVQVPVAAYVEQVYQSGDFSDFGIGT